MEDLTQDNFLPIKQLKGWYRDNSVGKGRCNIQHKDVLFLCLFLKHVSIISNSPLHSFYDQPKYFLGRATKGTLALNYTV